MADPLGFGDLASMVAGGAEVTASQRIALQKSAIPKLTTTQRDALTGADLFEGLVVYNTTTHKLNVRVAAAWEAVTSA
jgi:hypothetical protein